MSRHKRLSALPRQALGLWPAMPPQERRDPAERGLPRPSFGGLPHLLEVGRVAQVDRRIQLERVGEPQFLADLAHRRHYLLPQQADASPGVLVADRAVIAPNAIDARPGLLEDAAQFGDHGLWRAKKHAAVVNLLLEGWAAARVLGAPHRELDKVTTQRRREVARRVRPHRMRQAGELALHPQELSGVSLRLLLAVRDMDLLQVTAVLRARLVAGLQRDLVI